MRYLTIAPARSTFWSFCHYVRHCTWIRRHFSQAQRASSARIRSMTRVRPRESRALASPWVCPVFCARHHGCRADQKTDLRAHSHCIESIIARRASCHGFAHLVHRGRWTRRYFSLGRGRAARLAAAQTTHKAGGGSRTSPRWAWSRPPTVGSLAVTAFIVLGGGPAVVTNVAQISGSHGKEIRRSRGPFQSHDALGESLSRAALDLIVYKLRSRAPGDARLFMIFVAVFYFVFTVPGVAALYLGVAPQVCILAACGLMVVTVNELFGETHFGGNYMFYDGGALTVGALGFGKFLPQTFYERNTGRGRPLPRACFRDTNLIIAACCLAST